MVSDTLSDTYTCPGSGEQSDFHTARRRSSVRGFREEPGPGLVTQNTAVSRTTRELRALQIYAGHYLITKLWPGLSHHAVMKKVTARNATGNRLPILQCSDPGVDAGS